MKLRNKKTGEIVDYNPTLERWIGRGKEIKYYTSLAKLNAEWEDAPEEPKEYWCIDWTEDDSIFQTKHEDKCDDFNKEIGNYFNTREEAEKAVEKLKAVKRLKDKGFRFTGINDDEDSQELITQCGILCEADIYHLEKDEDFLLLFGGEE